MNVKKIRRTSSSNSSPTVEYVVQSGDTLCSLAVRFNTSDSCLRSLNARLGYNLPLLPGTKLNLPASTAASDWMKQHPECLAMNQPPQLQQKQESQPQKENEQQTDTIDQRGNYQKNVNGQPSANAQRLNSDQQIESPRLPASPPQPWSLLSRPSSIEDAQSLGWTFLDPEAEQPIQPGRLNLPLPRLLVPQPSPTTPESCVTDKLLLTPGRLRSIVEILPPRAEGLDLYLVFSTYRHGHSLRTLYELSVNMGLDSSTCCLLLASVADSRTLLGAFLPCPVRSPSPSGCYGTGETWVFRCRCYGVNIDEDFSAYSAAGSNSMFINSSRDHLSIGTRALTLRSDLLTGCSEACQTFGSPALIDAFEFQLDCVQLWAFQVMERN